MGQETGCSVIQIKETYVKVIDITHEMRREAEGLARSIGVLNNSITGGNGNLSGCLGEIAVRNFLNKEYGSDAVIAGDYDYDILTRKNHRIEVKTKRCKTFPRGNYECSVAGFNATQNCDFYVFTRISERAVYLLGYITKRELMQKATKKIKGETDVNWVDGKQFEFHADCYNLRITDLTPFKRRKKHRVH